MIEEIEMATDKLAELILYFADKSKDDPTFGSIKLNKMLFASDFLAYAYLGSSITGASYQHLEKGPAPRGLLPAREKLINEGRLELEFTKYFCKTQQRPVGLDEPELSVFSKDEIEICDYVIEQFAKADACDTSEWSHKILGWLNTEMKEEIPYYTAFLWQKNPIGKADLIWAEKQLTQHA